MTQKHIAFLVSFAVIAIAVIGIWTMRSSSGEQVAESAQSNAQTQIAAARAGGSVPLTGNPVGQVASEFTSNQSKTASCSHSYNSEVLSNAQFNYKNRTVNLSIKGFGNIKIALYDREAPKTVENFLRLVNSGYYNCITFHRVAKGFVIQAGDPTGTGTGGISAFGPIFDDEINPESSSVKEGYRKGVVAMANRGPNTNSSQFFIMLGDVPLEPRYTIFGKVTEGLDVVDMIGQVDIASQTGDPNDGQPVTPVVIEKAEILPE